MSRLAEAEEPDDQDDGDRRDGGIKRGVAGRHIFSSLACENKLAGIREEGRWFCHAVQGLSETAVVVSAELEPRLVRAMKGERVVLRHRDLAALTVRLRGGSADRPGLYAPILKRLASAGVPFVEIASVNDELVVLLQESFLARACEAVGAFVEAAK